MEVHVMQKVLPNEILAKFVHELDERNMGSGNINANRLMEKIEQFNEQLRKSFLEQLRNSSTSKFYTMQQ